MKNMPALPVDVPTHMRQVDGDRDAEPPYQTHRGKQATSRNVGGLPPQANEPDGPVRYEQI